MRKTTIAAVDRYILSEMTFVFRMEIPFFIIVAQASKLGLWESHGVGLLGTMAINAPRGVFRK